MKLVSMLRRMSQIPEKATPMNDKMLTTINMMVSYESERNEAMRSKLYAITPLMIPLNTKVMRIKPWYASSHAWAAESDPRVSESIVKQARDTPMKRTPVIPQTNPSTVRRHSLNKTALDAIVAIMASQGIHFRARDGEQQMRRTRDPEDISVASKAISYIQN
jgi:hypothetical protein